MDEIKPDESRSDVSFQVMPQSGNSSSYVPSAPTFNGNSNASVPTIAPNGSGGGGANWLYIIIAVVVLLGLAAGAYYFIGFGKKTNPETVQIPDHSAQNENPAPKLTVAFLQQYFQTDSCADQAVCGDNVDPDADGLSNYKEMVAGTIPIAADTDGDGLADGDEVEIYKTNPKNKYTDTRDIATKNDFNDGVSIKNGYNPNTAGVKFTDDKLAEIHTLTIQFGLHAPSTTTLGLKPDGSVAK